jgi:hypothetical protein
MTFLKILNDGTLYPCLQEHDLVIKVSQGKIAIGRFNRIRFITQAGMNDYILEPVNAADLKADAITFITAAMPELFGRQEPVYLVCPVRISGKAKWPEHLLAAQ